MMRAAEILVILCLVGAFCFVCQAQVQHCNPWSVPAMENFKLDSIKERLFYVQEIFVKQAEHIVQRGPCISHFVNEIESNGLFYLDENYLDERYGMEVKVYEMKHIILTPPAMFYLMGTMLFHEATAVYTDTDYDTYLILYICPLDHSFNPYERMLILTQSPSPSDALLKELEAVVEGHGFPKEYAVRINHTNCEL